jgi:hypothetical protein
MRGERQFSACGLLSDRLVSVTAFMRKFQVFKRIAPAFGERDVMIDFPWVVFDVAEAAYMAGPAVANRYF